MSHCVLLYGIYMAFEVGFSNLTYLRTLYLTPFVITFLNAVTRSAEAPGVVACEWTAESAELPMA